MPWSPFSHVPKKTGREGTAESEPSKLARKKKRPSYLQEFDEIAEGLEDNTPPVKEKEPEKEKKTTMPSIQEKPEAKVKEKSSYKKLISNLQTTYPDLGQEEALKGILALRVQNNGTLTGMTMLEIMERVIKFARPEKSNQEEPQPVKEPIAIEETQKPSESKKSYSKPEKEEAEAPTNGEDAMVSPSKTSQVDIARLDIEKYSPKSPKPVKTYSKKSNQNVESEDETVADTKDTPSNKKKNELSKEDEKPLDDSADDDQVEETPKKRRQNLDTSKRASRGRIKARESSLESVDDLLQSEQSEESDAYIQPEPSKKSPVRKKKASPKKKADKEEKAISDSEENENVAKDDEEYKTPKKSDRKKKDKVETPRTTSKSRGKKKEIEDTIEEEKAEESDASFNPEPPKKSHKKKVSPKKKEEPAEEDSDGEVEVQVAKKSPQKSKKKEETIKVMEVAEEEQPRTSRKRKIPSYLKEFAVEETKASEEPEKDDEEPVPETPKQKPSKRRKIEADPEPEPELEPETPKRKKATGEPKTPKRKKCVSDTATPKSKQKKKAVASATEYGECVLCGLMFDEESTKFCMTDKTRETGQTFADILFGLFHEESLPPSLAEKAKAVDLDGGSLCTLCVSHVDQLDVFQQKVTDIKTSIISIFIQKTRNDSLNQGEIESGDSETEEEAIVAKVTPKKKGKKRKGKAGKLVTLVYQSPLKKVRDLEAMSEKEISKMTETVIKYTPKKSPKKAKAVEDDNEEEDLDEDAPVKKIESKPDPDLALKLSALSGIEIKRVNTETGDESLQISGLAGIEIKKIDDSSSEKKTPSKKKTPKKEKTPGKTPGKRGRPKKSAAIEVAGEPVFEEACEELQNDLGGHAVNGEKNPIISSEEQAVPPAEAVVPPPVGNIAQGAMMPNIPVRGGPIRMSPGRGGRGARGGPRGGMGRGMVRPPGMNFRPTPPKSKKSLFELSQNKRKMGTLISNNGISIAPRAPVQNTPVLQNYRVNGIQATSTPIMAATVQTLHVPVTPLPVSTPVTLTPSKLNGLHGISITSSVTMTPVKEADIQAPAEVKEKKAYKKLISKIQAVHPDMSHEEAMRGIVALRTANNGTLTGMSMTEIITKVRANVRGEEKALPMETETEIETETETQATNSPAPPVGEAFEKIVNEALAPTEPPQSEMFLTPTKTVDPATLYEIKCKFCSRLFKSSSETATKKVYEIHIQEHEKETRSIFDKETPETELTEATPDLTQNPTQALTPTNNTEDNEEPDPVKSEKSYCKPCQKQFKGPKLYGLHQNTEHAAEIEFEKIMSSP